MDKLTVVRELQTVLAELYADQDEAERVAVTSGLNKAWIKFSARPVTNWYNIFREAEKRRRIAALLQIAVAENPESEDLKRLADAYLALGGQAGSAAAPATSPAIGPQTQAAAPGLSGRQFDALHAALLSAFTSDTLRQMVRTELDANLEQVAGGSNFSDVAFALIAWAERNGRLPDLLRGAHSAVPGNPKLNDFLNSLGWE